jgi:WhiB family redox-sensing transcriptional regulator
MNGSYRGNEDTDWRRAGACADKDPDLFFPIATTGPAFELQVATAKRVCEACLVARRCLEFAMRRPEATGIWAGTLPEDRLGMPRQHKETAVTTSTALEQPPAVNYEA